MPSSPISPRDLALKEKRFQSIEEVEAAYNILVRRLNDVYKYNRRDHDRLTEDVAVTSGRKIQEHTTDYQVLESEHGTVFTNKGATEHVTFTLPANATEGIWFWFCNQEILSDQVRVHPGSAKVLDSCNISRTANKYVQAPYFGNALGLIADSDGNWVTFTKYGTWTRET